MSGKTTGRWPVFLVAMFMLGLLVLPVLALLFVSSPSDLAAGMKHDLFMPALWLSIRTTVLSLAIVVLLGTLLVWWLAVASFC